MPVVAATPILATADVGGISATASPIPSPTHAAVPTPVTSPASGGGAAVPVPATRAVSATYIL